VFIAILYTTAPGRRCDGAAEPDADHRAGGPESTWPTTSVPSGSRTGRQTGLLGFEDKNGDGRIQYSADEERNELVKVDNDIIVLANPEIAGCRTG
jgi:cation/acetate symporter